MPRRTHKNKKYSKELRIKAVQTYLNSEYVVTIERPSLRTKSWSNKNND